MLSGAPTRGALVLRRVARADAGPEAGPRLPCRSAVDLGKVLLEFGAWDEADAQVELILGREPKNSQALTIRAGSLLGRGKAQEAVALLQAVSPGSNPEVDRIEPTFS